MDEIVMLFQEDGVAKCLYNEEIELRDIGKLYTYRASSIEFNNAHVRMGCDPGRWDLPW
jgi:hypothetical protein